MNRYFEHQELIKRTKILISKSFLSRMFDRHVGLFFKKRIDNGIINYSPIQINRKGMADNWGVIICYSIYDNMKTVKLPIHFEVETKTGKAVLSNDQKEWREFCDNLGIWWFENRHEIRLMDNIKYKAAASGLIVSEVNFGIRK